MNFTLRSSFAVFLSKLSAYLMRLFGSGGTTLPGKIATWVCPDLLNQLSDKFRIIMVTGTNGKTTTARMVAKILELSQISFITNKSGANLSSGITATAVLAVTISGKPKAEVLLLEVDEAAFRIVAPLLKPSLVIATNFFRDQLDRYGELYSTLNSVRSGLKGSANTQLVYNADDSLCASLGIDMETGKILPNRFSYGLSLSSSPGVEPEVSDAAFCIRCSARYEYTASSYGHLGHFICKNCGYQRPIPDVECNSVTADKSSSTIEISTKRGDYQAIVSLPGLYNVYNALSAAALAEIMNIPHEKTIEALASFERGFGRMEIIEIQKRSIQLILVKNPTGFNQVLQYISTLSSSLIPAFLINDQLADGTDVSWLWDVDFETYATVSGNAPLFAVSGIRADDMAIRLQYAGISEDKIQVFYEAEEMFDTVLQLIPEGGTVCLMHTYTAMLSLRKILAKRYDLKEFWK